jgi:L-threonylcarbamoyladenylate synthase
LAGDDSERPACSGRLESHYAPAAHLVLCSNGSLLEQAAEFVRTGRTPVGLLVDAGFDLASLEAALGTDRFSATVRRIDFPASLEAAAVRLYAALRELDRAGCQVGLAIEPPSMGIGVALRDRLNKAAAQRPAALPNRRP